MLPKAPRQLSPLIVLDAALLVQIAQGGGGRRPHHSRMPSQLPQVGRLTVSHSGRRRVAGLALSFTQLGPYATAGRANELDGEVLGAHRPCERSELVLLQGLVVLRLKDFEHSLDSVTNVLLQAVAPAANHKPAWVLRHLLGSLGDALALPANDLGVGAPSLALLADTDDIVIPGLARLELLDAPCRPSAKLCHRCLARPTSRASLEQEELGRLVRVVLRCMRAPRAQPGVCVGLRKRKPQIATRDRAPPTAGLGRVRDHLNDPMSQVELLLDVRVKICNVRRLFLWAESRASSVPATLRAAPRSVLGPQLQPAPLPDLGRLWWVIHGVLRSDQGLREVGDGSRGGRPSSCKGLRTSPARSVVNQSLSVVPLGRERAVAWSMPVSLSASSSSTMPPCSARALQGLGRVQSQKNQKKATPKNKERGPRRSPKRPQCPPCQTSGARRQGPSHPVPPKCPPKSCPRCRRPWKKRRWPPSGLPPTACRQYRQST